MNNSNNEFKSKLAPDYSLSELCILADISIRTARYYVQIGLVDKPDGETRAARYSTKHLEQLLLVKKWTQAGVALDRIKEILHGEVAPVPIRPQHPGSIEVRSHLLISDGIELVIEPNRANLSPEQMREFVGFVLNEFVRISQNKE